MDQAHYDELLSAYLDRELSPDERATVDRLLEQSSDARERLRELEATSRFMRTLPQHRLGVDFGDIVVDRLRSESLLRPEQVIPRPSNRRNVWWVGAPIAAAATLLVALGIWNYQLGHRDLARAPSPFDRGDTAPLAHDEAGEAVASIDRDQWKAGDVVEIRSPTGEKQFEMQVLAKTIESNTILCTLAESRDPDPIGSGATTPQNEPAVTPGGTTLAIEANQEQLDQFKELLAQSDDGAGVAFPLLEIVTDTEPERIRVAGIVGPQARSLGLGGTQEPFAARQSDKMDDVAGATERPKDQASPAFAAEQLGATADARRKRSVAQPPASPPTKEEQMGGPVALKKAAALQDRGQQVPVKIVQMDVKQQAVKAPDATAATAAARSTSDQIGNLAKSKPPDRPGLVPRPAQHDDKEPQGRAVLLRFRTDRPE